MGGIRCRCCTWDLFIGACRFFGIATALVLWGVGVEYVFRGTVFGIYFLIIAAITTFLELVFLLNHIVDVCVSRTSIILRLWDWVQWFDDWKKGGLYFALFAPACFARPAEVELGLLAGSLLVITGVLYMIKTFKTKQDEEGSSIGDDAPYGRFEDDVQDLEDDVPDLEDDITNPTSGPAGMTSVAEQSEILDL